MQWSVLDENDIMFDEMDTNLINITLRKEKLKYNKKI
jgi:hypothetical protein